MAARESAHGIRRTDVIPQRLQQYQLSRRKFACQSYLLATLWGLISVSQWITFAIKPSYREWFKNSFYIAIVCLNLSLFLVSIFIFFERSRFSFPYNWLASLMIVEALTFGLMCGFALGKGLMVLVSSIALAVALVLCCVLVGIIIPHDFTLDVVILFMSSVLMFIGSVFFVMLHVVAQLPGAIYIYTLFVVIAVTSFIIYHAQTINGGRYAEMRVVDYLLASLIIYHDFVILLIVMFFIMSTILKGYEEYYLLYIYPNATAILAALADNGTTTDKPESDWKSTSMRTIMSTTINATSQ